LLKIMIERRIFEGNGGVGREHFEERDSGWRENARRQVVLQIEDSGQPRLLEQRHTENRTRRVPAQILVVGELGPSSGILQKDVASRTQNVLENGLWQIAGLDTTLPQADGIPFVAGPGLSLDPISAAVRNDQKASPRPGLLESQAQDGRTQRRQVGLPLHRL